MAWRTALRDIGATLVVDDEWDFMLPPMGKGSRVAVDELRPSARKVIGALRGADALASKRALWSCMVLARGREGAREFIPETFLLDNPADRRFLAVAHREGDRWVLKHPHKQARTGLRLLTHPREARRSVDEGWTVLQRFVPDVLTQGGHRLHIRRYVVVVVDRGRVSSFVAGYGKVLYARAPVGDAYDEASAFTTSRDRWTGPSGVAQTWSTLVEDLATQGHAVDALEPRVQATLAACVSSAVPLLDPAHLHHCRLFQIFGVDIVLDARLQPWLLEANKRPEMRPRADDDGPAKLELLRQTFRLGMERPHRGFTQLTDEGF